MAALYYDGEFELRRRVDSVGGGGEGAVAGVEEALARRLQLDDGVSSDEESFDLDDNGSVASLEPIAKDKNANIRLAIVGTLGLICGVSFTIFLFLIPFQIDPAAAALVADFVPSTCSVVNASMALGLSQCHWDPIKCFRILVSYVINDTVTTSSSSTSSSSTVTAVRGDSRVGALFVNVAGCGYPPTISCEGFYEEYGRVMKQDFPCFYSVRNHTMVIPEHHPAEEIQTIVMACIPLLITVVSGILLLVVPGRLKSRGSATKVGPASAEDRARHPEELDRSEESSIMITRDPVPPLLPPDPGSRFAPEVGGSKADFGNGHLINGGDPFADAIEPNFLSSGTYKRKTNTIELPTLQKRIRHRE